MNICNVAGEVVMTVGDREEAARWWLDFGRRGDYVEATDELLSEVATSFGHTFFFDPGGCVVDRGGRA